MRARIGNLLFGGIGRSAITSAGIGVSLGDGLFWLVLTGGPAHVDRQLYGYQKELASLCDSAPVEGDGQLVRLYRGLVVETPSILGQFDRGQPVGPPAGRAAEPLHLLAETTDQPVGYLKYIVLLHRPGNRPEIDTRLQFCGGHRRRRVLVAADRLPNQSAGRLHLRRARRAVQLREVDPRPARRRRVRHGRLTRSFHGPNARRQ